MHFLDGGDCVSLQVIINGLVLGGLYACVGMGFSLVYGVLGISNLSHGALLMLGSYVTYWLFTLYGVDPFLSIIPAMAVLFIIGYLMQRGVINRTMGAEARTSLILTFGFQWLLINVALYIFHGDYRAVSPSYAGEGFNFGSLTIPYARLGVVLIALPHLIGAPHPSSPESAVPAVLAAEFAARSIASMAVFWIVLGAVFGWALTQSRIGAEA